MSNTTTHTTQPKGILNREPAGTIGTSITAVLVALFAVLRAFGVGVTDEMSDGLVALVLALSAIPAVSGWLTRAFVYAPDTHDRDVDAAYQAGAARGDAGPGRGGG